MSKWDFKAVRLGVSSAVKLVNLSPTQKSRINEYTKALEIATKSTVANPSFSNYFVKESIGFVKGELIPAGNIEYGFCQALHAEEAAVAAFRARYGRIVNNKDIILGIIAGAPGALATPCGNCRDILLQDLGSDFEIVSGAASGGPAVVANMNQYLFSDFQKLSLADIPKDTLKKIGIAIQQGALLVNDAYSPAHIHPERRYHALIATKKNLFVGARDVMCDYHPIYALRDAVRQTRRARDPDIQSVIVVCEDFNGGAPQVMYKDRQHLTELNLQAELLSGEERDPPVILATYSKEQHVVRAWKTSVKALLPLPFTPRNFGPKFMASLVDYFKNRR